MMRTLVATLVVMFLSTQAACVLGDDAEDKDTFSAGSLWVGEVRIGPKEVPPGTGALTIGERTGEKFKGELSVRGPGGKTTTWDVEGTATRKATGAIIFETKKEGLSQIKLRGKLLNGVATLAFVGTGPFGEKGGGGMVLKKKQ